MNKKIEARHIEDTLSYFAHFQYPPTRHELFLFSPVPISKKSFYKAVDQFSVSKRVIDYPEKTVRYVRRGHEKFFEHFVERAAYAAKKRVILDRYLAILRYVPSVAFVGISGSLSMNNTRKTDDIDLFIITEQQQLWTGRILAVLLAELLGNRRRRNDPNPCDKICLNLFFDATDLTIPQDKQILYIAHEILQLRPVMNRSGTYERFLQSNDWVLQFFPNAAECIPCREHHASSHTLIPKQNSNDKFGAVASSALRSLLRWTVLWWMERLARSAQLAIIRQHTTNERITDTQLWFFPHDYEQELK